MSRWIRGGLLRWILKICGDIEGGIGWILRVICGGLRRISRVVCGGLSGY